MFFFNPSAVCGICVWSFSLTGLIWFHLEILIYSLLVYCPILVSILMDFNLLFVCFDHILQSGTLTRYIKTTQA